MNYDIIPEYNVIFSNDKFKLDDISFPLISIELSILGYMYTEQETCKKTLLSQELGLIGIDKNGLEDYLRDKRPITVLGILRAWKVSFEKLNNNDSQNYLQHNLNYLYRLIIKEQEDCVNEFEKKDVYNSLMTFTLLNYLDNVNNECFRVYYMFIKNKDLFSKKYSKQNFSDIYRMFEDKYKITLYEYIEVLCVLVMYKFEVNFKVLKETKNVSNYDFMISLEQIVNRKTKENVRKVLEILSFDYKEAHEWSTITKEQRINFKLFQEKPLYKISEDLYVPITRKFMQDQIFNSLLYKIKSCYAEKDVSFWNVLGYLFEEYIEYILQETIKNVNLDYRIIHKFQYGTRKNSKDSPDLILTMDNDVFVFELKAARPLNSIFISDNDENIQNSIDKVIKNPIRQSIQRIKEIVKINTEEKINDKSNYYFIAITIGNFPDHYSDYGDLKEIIRNSGLNINGLFNFNVEEFELLCMKIEEGDETLMQILENYKLKQEHYSFKNFLNRMEYKSCTPRFFKELEDDFVEFLNKIKLE